MRKLNRDAALALGTAIVGRSLTFSSTFLLNKILGKTDFGAYAYIVATITSATSLGVAGAGQVAVKTVAANIDKPNTIALSVRAEMLLILMTTCAITLLLLLYFLATGKLSAGPTLGKGVIIATAVFFSAYAALFLGVLTGYRLQGRILLATSTSGAAFLIASVVLGQYAGYMGAIISYASYMILQCAILLQIVSRKLRQEGARLFGKISLKNLHSSWQANGPMFGATAAVAIANWISMTALYRADSGSNGVAEIFVALQWKNMVLFVPAVFSQLLIERLSRSLYHDGKASFNSVAHRGLLLNCATSGSLAALFIVFTPQILSMYGSAYSDIKLVFALIIATAVINATTGALGKSYIATGRTIKYLQSDLIWASIVCIGSAGIYSLGPIGYAVVHAAAATVQLLWQLRTLKEESR